MVAHIRYFVRLILSLRKPDSMPGPSRRRWALPTGAALAALVLYGAVPLDAAGRGERARDPLAVRMAAAEAALGNVERVYERQVAPLERVLSNYSDDQRLVRRISVALLRNARATNVEPRLLLAVLLVENPWLDPQIRSPVGAVGLMQVMPFHEGEWAPCAPNLEDVEANICHGARIFASYLRSSGGNLDRALLRYNGCVNGTNTPNCHLYPNHVYARAGRASLLAWRRSLAGADTP